VCLHCHGNWIQIILLCPVVFQYFFYVGKFCHIGERNLIAERLRVMIRVKIGISVQ